MRRGLLLLVAVIALAMTPALSSAQFGGISGLPTFGNFFGSGAGCGDPKTPGLAPAVYFGWMPDIDNGVGASLDAQRLGVNNITNIVLKYRTSGFWLGGALPVQLTDSISFIGTGWYLFPSDSTATINEWIAGRENNPLSGASWNKRDVWWFVDGVFAWGNSNFSALLGLRYDKFSTRYDGPTNTSVPPLIGDGANADFISHGLIPLIGAQAGFKNSVSALNVRIVGIPTLAGDAKVNFTINNAARLEASGNYNGGHFLEVFAEYSRQIFVNSNLGVFMRWNTARGTSDMDTSLTGFQDASYLFSFNRQSWTFGGLLSFAF